MHGAAGFEAWTETEDSASELTTKALCRRLPFVTVRASLWAAHNMAFPRATDPGEREKERNVTLTFTIPPEITPSHLPYLVCI